VERLIGGQPVQDLMGFIQDIRYPARKDEVIHAARRNGAPDEVVAELERLPVRDFQNSQEVLDVYGTLE
jgi:hypothetical protein